jgi:HK97 gp10 family phage protein
MASKVTGLDLLRKKIAALPGEMQTEIRKAMEKGADEMVALARSLAPVDSGALRDSIGWTWGEAPKGSLALARASHGDMTLTIYAGSRDKSLGDRDAFYVRWVEFGTATHPQGGMFAGTTHPGTTAQPFFFPAWRAVRKRVKNRNTRAVRTAIKKVAAGGK